MEYHNMPLVELKQLAKDHKPKIKQYYIKKRHELIQLLSMEQLPESYILEKKKRSELLKEAKDRGYTKLYTLKREDLLELLYPSLKQDNKNNNHTQKHNNPKHGEGE